MTAARAGDRDASAALAERHRPALLRACRGSADAARDALLTAIADLRREPPAMPGVHMRVTGVVPADPLHILLLEETGGARRLPIWIPPAEGERIAARLRREDRPRPDTYRFTADLLAANGRLADTILYAEAVLQDGTAAENEAALRARDA